jgi:hypothetical protein
MVKLTLNNEIFEVADGLTILDVANNAGIHIPTLCHNKDLPHYSSCMVCLVKDKLTGNYLPSCSALVQDGMDIECSSEDVINLRSKAVELLLLEHRAECEAPCKIVCPAGYNIPLMNRHLAAKNYTGAIGLFVDQIGSDEFLCPDCPGYCENACRRKKVDMPVSIKNLLIFISQKLIPEINDHPQKILPEGNRVKPAKPLKAFSSRIGRLEAVELKEWLKESGEVITRVREIFDTESATCESESCMHCDCRAVDNCHLRDIARELSVKDPRGKLINSPIQKKININTGLIFENAKCIKCGLCVRLCEELKEEPALCFINKGFVSIISEPLTEDFNNILKTKSQEIIDICPTGALSRFRPHFPMTRDLPPEEGHIIL